MALLLLCSSKDQREPKSEFIHDPTGGSVRMKISSSPGCKISGQDNSVQSSSASETRLFEACAKRAKLRDIAGTSGQQRSKLQCISD